MCANELTTFFLFLFHSIVSSVCWFNFNSFLSHLCCLYNILFLFYFNLIKLLKGILLFWHMAFEVFIYLFSFCCSVTCCFFVVFIPQPTKKKILFHFFFLFILCILILFFFLFTFMTRKWTLFIGNLHVLYNRGLHGHKATHNESYYELRIILFAKTSGRGLQQQQHIWKKENQITNIYWWSVFWCASTCSYYVVMLLCYRQ